MMYTNLMKLALLNPNMPIDRNRLLTDFKWFGNYRYLHVEYVDCWRLALFGIKGFWSNLSSILSEEVFVDLQLLESNISVCDVVEQSFRQPYVTMQ